MVARSKVVVAKWGVPAKEPEDLPDFLSNEEIAEKMGGDPRGVYRLWVKKITVIKNKNDDDMLKITAEIFETNKEKKGYNGWVFWENQNVTEQGASFLKQFLKSIGATWADFQKRTKLINQSSATEPTEVVAIGPVNLAGTKKVLARATVGMDRGGNGYDPKPAVRRWLPPADDADVQDEEDLDEEDLEEDLDEEDLEEVDEEDEEDDEAETELRDELGELGMPDLRKRAKTNDADVKTTGLNKAALIDLIVGQELVDEEDLDEEEEEDEDLGDEEEGDEEEELREELGELTLGALKMRAKKGGAKVAVLKPIKTKAKVIDIIVEQELGGDEDEPPF